MATAVGCVRDVYPQCTIETIRVDNPLQVTISAELPTTANSHGEDSDDTSSSSTLKRRSSSTTTAMLWTCKQQNLFERNPKRRKRAMMSIRQTLTSFKEQLTLLRDSSYSVDGDGGNSDGSSSRSINSNDTTTSSTTTL
jgi:hypothetical protein